MYKKQIPITTGVVIITLFAGITFGALFLFCEREEIKTVSEIHYEIDERKGGEEIEEEEETEPTPDPKPTPDPEPEFESGFAEGIDKDEELYFLGKRTNSTLPLKEEEGVHNLEGFFFAKKEDALRIDEKGFVEKYTKKWGQKGPICILIAFLWPDRLERGDHYIDGLKDDHDIEDIKDAIDYFTGDYEIKEEGRETIKDIRCSVGRLQTYKGDFIWESCPVEKHIVLEDGIYKGKKQKVLEENCKKIEGFAITNTEEDVLDFINKLIGYTG